MKDATHSAAMMMGIGRDAFPNALTTLGRFDQVRLGELSK